MVLLKLVFKDLKNKLKDVRIISSPDTFFRILYLKQFDKNCMISLTTHHEQKWTKKEMRRKSFLPDFQNSLTLNQA
jgi:phage-related protein